MADACGNGDVSTGADDSARETAVGGRKGRGGPGLFFLYTESPARQ